MRGVEPVAAEQASNVLGAVGAATLRPVARAQRKRAAHVAIVEAAAAQGGSQIPRSGAITEVCREHGVVKGESAAAERGAIVGVTERQSRKHLVGDLHVTTDHNGIVVAVAAAGVTVAIVVTVVVDGIGIELVRRPRRAQAGPHAVVECAEIRLLGLQRCVGQEADLLRRIDHRGGVVGDDLMACRGGVHRIGKRVGLRGVRRHQCR